MRKLLTILIVAVMLTSTVVCNASATSDYAADLLSALSIMEGDTNGNMRYEDNVSRAECAKIVVNTSAYRDYVEKEGASSSFKDIPYTHWASAYISVGVKNGLFKGYFDATFRPSNTVLLEEATIMFLRILGYSGEDFGNDWPHDQVIFARKIGLLDDIYKSVGEELNRRDISILAYNTLISKPKGSDYTHMSIFNKIVGPKTVLSSDWYTEFGADSSIIIMRNGERVSATNVKINDIAYYMEEYKTALIFSDKVTGIYQSAAPNKNAPETVTVSGVTYKLEGKNAYTKLSSNGSFKYGDTVTLLLGKNGDVADVVTNTQLTETVYGFLSAVGTKETSVAGKTAIKPFARIVLPTGEVCEYTTNKNYDSIVNSVVSVKFEDGIAIISSYAVNHNISGKFVWGSGENSIGGSTLADDVKIIETSTTSSGETSTVESVYPQRLNGLKISEKSILYVSKNQAGHIDSMILNDVTGDTHTYAIISKAKNSSNEFSSSGNYEYVVNGTEGTLLMQNKTFSVSTGQVVKIKSNGKEITSMIPLTKVTETKITNINGSEITVGGQKYTMSDKVQIYLNKAFSSSAYVMITLDEFAEMAQDYQAYVYTDKANSQGGRVRIIVLK